MHFLVGVVIGEEKWRACCVDCAVEESLSPFCNFGCDEAPSARMRNLKERGVKYKEPKWDWYRIGGRFLGWFSGFDFSQDPRYWMRCPRCNGVRQNPGGKSCTYCAGRGFYLDPFHPNEIGSDGDIWPIADLLNRDRDTWVPHAILTPDGQWTEIPLPIDADPNPEAQKVWPASVRKILHNYRDHFMVAVDCHC